MKFGKVVFDVPSMILTCIGILGVLVYASSTLFVGISEVEDLWGLVLFVGLSAACILSIARGGVFFIVEMAFVLASLYSLLPEFVVLTEALIQVQNEEQIAAVRVLKFNNFAYSPYGFIILVSILGTHQWLRYCLQRRTDKGYHSNVQKPN